MTDDGKHDEWKALWAMPEEDEMNLVKVQQQFNVRRTRQEWRDRLDVLAVILGVFLTIGFLVFTPLTVPLVVLVLFCWVVWAISLWGSRDSRKTAREVMTRPTTEYVPALRAHCEARQRLVTLRRHILVAAGVFCVVWTAWVMSANWDDYVREPWRGVVGVGGLVFFFGVGLYFHSGESRRWKEETEELERLEQRLGDPE